MIGDLSGFVAAAVATLTSFVLGLLTHSRSKRAHKDELAVDHAKMIQQAYQEILDELRNELERRKISEEELRGRVIELEKELEKETTLRQELEVKFNIVDEQLQTLQSSLGKPANERVEEHEEQHHDN